MTTSMDMRASSLSSSLFSSFFLASVPPNSASGSGATSESPLWCSREHSSRFVSLKSFEDIALAGGRALGLPVVRRKEKRLQLFLARNFRCHLVYDRRNEKHVTHPEIKVAPYSMVKGSRARTWVPSEMHSTSKRWLDHLIIITSAFRFI